MSDKNSLSGKIRQSGLKWVAVAVIIAAFACALFINIGLRAPVEAADRTVGLLVDYDELKRISDGSHDIEFRDMVRKASLAGATGLVVRERLLADWEIAGDILVYTGGQLSFQIELQLGESADEVKNSLALKPDNTYILTKDPLVYDQLFSLLEAKRRYPARFDFQGYMGIATSLNSSERATLGLGFPLAYLEDVAAEGFQIIARLRNWEPVTGENLAEVMRWAAKIPNLAAIGFNDQSLPGDVANPILLDRMAESLSTLQVPLVSFEFYDQVGLSSLASRMETNLLRVHAIAENELQKYADTQDAMDRYGLAATERNIRYIYLRFQGLVNPQAAMQKSTELIEFVHDGLIGEGLSIGNPEPIPAFEIPMPLIYILGASVIAAGGWLITLVGEPFFGKRKWRIPFIIMIVLGLAAWAAGLVIMPIFARKLFALAGAIFFPSLGIIMVLTGHNGNVPLRPKHAGSQRDKDTRKPSPVFRLPRAILQFLIMSALTICGGLIMSALLAEPVFMLKLDGFAGVKASHIIPLALVPFILWIREEDCFGLMSGTVKSNVRFWQLGLCLALLGALALYILRTGNDSPEAVFSIELQFRQMLNNLLGVRPRTTEFLIGHPLMLVLLFYGYRFNMFPLLMIGLMGQVSLMNTYAHIHTPLLVSLQRSGHGLWIGMLLGTIIIAVLELILRQLRKANERRAECG